MIFVLLFTVSCILFVFSSHAIRTNGNLGVTANYLDSSPSEEYQEALLASRNNVYLDESNLLRSELYSKKSQTRLRKQRQSYSFGETSHYKSSTMTNSTTRSNSSFENFMPPLQSCKPWLRFLHRLVAIYPNPPAQF